MSKQNKVDITKDGYNSIISKVMQNIQEERDLALDRYRYQDQQMTNPEDFVLQGKDVVSFLKLASDRTNAMLLIAKEIKEIAYLDEMNKTNTSNTSTVMDDRKAMEEMVRKMKKDTTVDDIKNEDLKPDEE